MDVPRFSPRQWTAIRRKNKTAKAPRSAKKKIERVREREK
jgi:hypothetical protein